MASLALTQSAAQAMLETYGNIVKTAIEGEYSPVFIKSQLEEIQEILVERAKEVYSYLGFTGNSYESIVEFEEKLNNRIKIATENSNKIGKLSGLELDRNFVRDLEKAEIFNLDIQDKWEDFWNMCVEQVKEDTNKSVEESLPELAKEVANALFPTVSSGSYFMGNQMLGYLREGVSSKKLGKNISKRINLGKINETFAACGPKIRTAFMKYLDNNPDFGQGSKSHLNSIAKFEQQEGSTLNGVSYTLTLNTKEYSGLTIENVIKMRQEEREKVFAGLPEGQKMKLVQQINQAYAQKIKNVCQQANQKYLDIAIDKVINGKGDYWKHALGLFSSTAKDLTGILGEIQGIYFLLEISDGKLIDKIDWLGGINNPHTDILLGNFGAQVKNTTKDISSQDYAANFQRLAFSKNGRELTDDGFYNMFHTEGAQASMAELGMLGEKIPPQLMDAIENLLGLESFNVEYQRVKERMSKNPKRRSSHKKSSDGKKIWAAREMGNPDFAATRSKIVKAANDCQILMGLFAARMMYMQVAEVSKGESNTIYIAGGAIIISAASIIGGMIKELESGMDRYTKFNTTIGAANQKGSFTIVDMINGGGDKSLNNVSFGLQTSYTFIKH